MWVKQIFDEDIDKFQEIPYSQGVKLTLCTDNY